MSVDRYTHIHLSVGHRVHQRRHAKIILIAMTGMRSSTSYGNFPATSTTSGEWKLPSTDYHDNRKYGDFVEVS